MMADKTSASSGDTTRKSLLVCLGRDDLQQGDDLAGGRQPVLDQAVVADLQDFLDPAAREPEDFHGGPCPERVVVFEFQVAAPAGCRVVGPGLEGGLRDGPGQRLACGCECLAGLCPAGGPQNRGGVLAPLVDSADQDRQDGQSLTGPRVHAGLAVTREFALADLLLPDRAGRGPPCPPGGVLDRPLGQVQVEGPDRGEALAVADPLGGDDGPVPVRRADDLGLGPLPLFPLVGDLAGQARGCRCRDGAPRGRPRTVSPGSRRASSGWCSPRRAGVRAGSPRSGPGPACTAAGSGRRVPPA